MEEARPIVTKHAIRSELYPFVDKWASGGRSSQWSVQEALQQAIACQNR